MDISKDKNRLTLKDCPFCGGEASFDYNKEERTFRSGCSLCDIWTPKFVGRGQMKWVLETWNQRRSK
jgi:hypothetical protein